MLYHRLYEAHFLPTHLSIALLSAVIYTAFVPAVVTHPALLAVFSFCGTLRFIGMFLTGCYLYLYESYHQVCIRYREDEMKRAGLYDDMAAQDSFTHRHWKTNWSDYCCLPITGLLFATIPAVVVSIKHFYTDKMVYTVSAKPQKIADTLHFTNVTNVANNVVDQLTILA